MDLLVLGVVLLVLGLGATFIYDKAKANKVTLQKFKENKIAQVEAARAASAAIWKQVATPSQKKSQNAPLSVKPDQEQNVDSLDQVKSVKDLIDLIERMKNGSNKI